LESKRDTTSATVEHDRRPGCSATDARPDADADLPRSASGRYLWRGRVASNAGRDTWLESFQRSLRKLPDYDDDAGNAEDEDQDFKKGPAFFLRAH